MTRYAIAERQKGHPDESLLQLAKCLEGRPRVAVEIT